MGSSEAGHCARKQQKYALFVRGLPKLIVGRHDLLLLKWVFKMPHYVRDITLPS
jgi:hypothetical protein